MKFLNCLALLIAILATSACATYQRKEVEFHAGSKILDGKNGQRVAVFIGDKNTSSARSFRYSRLAAISECNNTDKLALFSETFDVSKESTYTEITTSTYNNPVYSYGRNGKVYQNPLLSRTQTDTTATPVTVILPRFATPFRCVEQVTNFKSKISQEFLSRELVSPFTKDFKGGILIKDSEDRYLLSGDVITHINGTRIETMGEEQAALAQAIGGRKGKEGKAKLKVIRKSSARQITVEIQNSSEDIMKYLMAEIVQACEMRNVDEPQIRLCSVIALAAKAADAKKPVPETLKDATKK